MKQNTIRVRVISPIVTKGFRKLTDLEALEYPDIKLSHAEITQGLGSIESEFEAVMCAPATLVEVRNAATDDIDAAIIDCMGDPGLRPAGEIAEIVVVGPAQTAMHISAIPGHKFSVITFMRRLKPSFENTATRCDLSTKVASVRSVDIPVLDLETDKTETLNRLIEKDRKAVEEDGAEALIFGYTGLMGCASGLRAGLLVEGIEVPVIDPIPTEISVASEWSLSGYRKTGQPTRPHLKKH